MKAGFYLAGLEGIGARSLRQFVDFWKQQQVSLSIYVDGPIRKAAVNVMSSMSQHAFELKCWGSAPFERMGKLASQEPEYKLIWCPS